MADEEQIFQAKGQSQALPGSQGGRITDGSLAMDFVYGRPATARKFRIFIVVENRSRYVPVFDARYSYCGKAVVQTLERVCAQTGTPKQSGSSRAPSSYHATLIPESSYIVLRSTSHGLAIQPTIP